MTFKKPEISYTEMCIYIDENIYKESFDESLIYQYIYHIIYMLAKKAGYFKQHHYYDDFALYAASRVYFRLTSPKQNELDSNGNYKLDKIKSVLNYIKKIIYPLKVDFEQGEYCQTISKDAYTEEINYNFTNLLNNSVDELTFCEFGLTFNNIGKTCEAFLKTIPYKPNTGEWLNIYTSVMLTFLNTITLTNRRKNRLEHLNSTMRLNDNHIINAFEEESCKAILFHLPESMNDYILVLTRQLKHLVAKDLSDILHTNISNDLAILPLSVKEYIESYEELEDEY